MTVDLVDPYRPSWRGNVKRGGRVQPEDLAGWDAAIWPENDVKQ